MSYPFYIACAELTTRTAQENATCMAQAQAIARTLDVPFDVVQGAYKGARETSLALYGPRAALCARALAVVFEQETVLEVRGYHEADLLDAHGNSVVCFRQRVAGSADNYTVIAGGDPFTFI